MLVGWMGGICPSFARPVECLCRVRRSHVPHVDAVAIAPVSSNDVMSMETDVFTTVEQTPLPPGWLALPFVLLLLMIATGPLLYKKFWHQHYTAIVCLLVGGVTAYYGIFLNGWSVPVIALGEYIQFIALIASLYMVSGGILITFHRQATPLINLSVLLTGAILSNLIGTTGASMLLIRPYIRLNADRIRAYHVIFFIFIVSNVGGVLTPIGDPPLFLGFLSGVPFFWTLQHNLLPWIVALLLLSIAFVYIDNHDAGHQEKIVTHHQQPILHVVGKHNLWWFAVIIGTVFLDPHLFRGIPMLHYGQHSFSFIREFILLSVGWIAYYYADPIAKRVNAFSFEPLREVSVLFAGLFGTMMPALQLVRAFATTDVGHSLITHHTLYWGTGFLSSMLDNAPTYMSFCAASMAAQGVDINAIADVKAFASGGGFHNAVLQLRAISIASVFFGAMTYIGNGPNFMVKSIAEHHGLQMPSFTRYILNFSVPILLPVLFIIWLLFFAFAV